MKGLSKSRYPAFCQCPKNLWLKVYKPEEAARRDINVRRACYRRCIVRPN